MSSETDTHGAMASDATDVVIAGTGVAGLSAATLLADQGLAVTLIAAGQHEEGEATGTETLAADGGDVMLGCCGHLLSLHRRLGLEGRIRWDRQLHWIEPGGPIDTLAGDDLPAPLHMLRSLLGLSIFSTGQRVSLLRGMLALMQVSEASRSRLANQSLADWLRTHRQAETVIERFWSPLSAVACGGRADRVIAGEAIRLLQAGLLHHESTYELGVSPVTHAELLAAAKARIEQAGGRVLADGGLTRIEVADDRVVRLHQADGQEVPANEAILSLAPPRLLEAGSDLSRIDGRFGQLAGLEPMPRVDVQLSIATRAGRALMTEPHLIPMDSAVPLILQRGVDQPAGDERVEHLQAVIPAAGPWIDRSDAQLAADVEAELRRLLPTAAWHEVRARRIDRRPALTYTLPVPPGGPRPSITGSIDNLYLAGGWADTGWPASLEGAAAAGTAAAHHVLGKLGRQAPEPVEAQSTPSLLYRLLSG